MKKSIFFLAILLGLSCQEGKPKKTSPAKTDIFKETAFLKEMDSLYSIGVFNGFSASVVDTSGILFNQGYGYADVRQKKEYTENTIINIASISKVFIGMALLKAEELDLIDLDDPINLYLPFNVINPNFPDEDITLRQLATHTSSIVDQDIYMQTCYVNKDDISLVDSLEEKYGSYYQNPSENWMPLKDYLNGLLSVGESFYNKSTFSDKPPGQEYAYTNIGAALCALVIEFAAEKPFNEFTKAHIFDPLKMASTHWFFEESESVNHSKLYYKNQELPFYKILSYPDGGLITSNTDLSLFLSELIKGYFGKGMLLSSESYQEFFKSQLSTEAFGGKENYNVGIFLEKELAYDVIGHSGGDPGTNTMMYFNTETKTGKILIINTDTEKKNDNVFWGIWNTLDTY